MNILAFRMTKASLAWILGTVAAMWIASVAASQTDIPAPTNSGAFGTTVAVLPNGNIVVTDPSFGSSATPGVGAVYLYDGAGLLISVLTGSHANDHVGSEGITVLANGNFVASSSAWLNSTGAVTWVSGVAGLSGVVSPENSFIGDSEGQAIGATSLNRGITALPNGNYVINSNFWDGASASAVGAVTWGNGTTGLAGTISAANSLAGTTDFDRVGLNGITVLANGNYVVASGHWNNGAAQRAGAITLCDGSSGRTGFVSQGNSLVGNTTEERVGFGDSSVVTPLTNGNFVVATRGWNNGSLHSAGAVTWVNGTTGLAGPVSAVNSLVGGSADDNVGYPGVTALANGNYVVASYEWNNGAARGAGAATWANGETGLSGEVTEGNSLVGTTTFDSIGVGGVVALANGNYVVASSGWTNGGQVGPSGAVTWGDGAAGLTGPVTQNNSLIGHPGDAIGFSVTALANGNYVVASPTSLNGAGAATWASGTMPSIGFVSSFNSLVGSTMQDFVGGQGVVALANGNYVVVSTNWNDGSIAHVGAVTWASGSAPLAAEVSAANSLIGSSEEDGVGAGGVTALDDGSYVVASSNWRNGDLLIAGAITRGGIAGGIHGFISASNSLVGNSQGDRLGTGEFFNRYVRPLSNGHYVVYSPYWNNGTAPSAGAVTLSADGTGVTGAVRLSNSVLGSTAGSGGFFSIAEDAANDRVIVGQGLANRVTILTRDADAVFADGFEQSDSSAGATTKSTLASRARGRK